MNNANYVTVVSVGNDRNEDFVTVLSIGDEEHRDEEVQVYRLPGERLGFGLKFEGGNKTTERVRRLFVQSCAKQSPASRVKCTWGSLGEGDEVISIDGTPVTEMTRLDCVRRLKESQLVIKLLIRCRGSSKAEVISAERKPTSPPPVPPRKLRQARGSADGEATSTSPKIVPPEAALTYLDARSHGGSTQGSTSDETGSSMSTVIIPSEKILYPPLDSEFMQPDYLLRLLATSESVTHVESRGEIEKITAVVAPNTILIEETITLQPPLSFQDAPLSYGHESRPGIYYMDPATHFRPIKDDADLVERVNCEDENNNNEEEDVAEVPPKPLPRRDVKKRGKRPPPPPPPPPQIDKIVDMVELGKVGTEEEPDEEEEEEDCFWQNQLATIGEEEERDVEANEGPGSKEEKRDLGTIKIQMENGDQRSPPDGDEFPTTYEEQPRDRLLLYKNIEIAGYRLKAPPPLPATAPPEPQKRLFLYKREDDKSEKSVRDKIAMFSLDSTPLFPLSKYKSVEDVNRLTRANSFTGQDRSNRSGIDRTNSFRTNGDEVRRNSLNQLIEQRRKSISKLRGLVIPEKECVRIVDLPEIKSRDSILLRLRKSTTRIGPSGPAIVKTNFKIPPPPQINCKYSPAFKRKTFTLCEDSDNDSAVSSSQSVSPIPNSLDTSPRILKPQSVEAINRKNILASARCRSGKDDNGSPLIQRKLEPCNDLMTVLSSKSRSRSAIHLNETVQQLEDIENNCLDRERYGSISSLASSTTSLISPNELAVLLEEASLEESRGSHDVVVVLLHKENQTGSVGITLAGGVDCEVKEITVHRVLGGSIADKDGRVLRGDRILSINGRSTRGLTHKESLGILKQPRSEVVLVVSRARTTRTASVETIVEGSETNVNTTSTVAVYKDGAGLGFSLEGGRDSPLGDRALIIKKIFTGGAAEKTGALRAGDELLQVNGQDVTRMSRIEAWSLMKKLQDGEVSLLVRHPIK